MGHPYQVEGFVISRGGYLFMRAAKRQATGEPAP